MTDTDTLIAIAEAAERTALELQAVAFGMRRQSAMDMIASVGCGYASFAKHLTAIAAERKKP